VEVVECESPCIGHVLHFNPSPGCACWAIS
jgi:hypothetical protein